MIGYAMQKGILGEFLVLPKIELGFTGKAVLCVVGLFIISGLIVNFMGRE